MSNLTVLIADDNFVARRGLRSFLLSGQDISVVGEASNGLEAVHWMRRSSADVVLMDVRMPKMDGITATREILKIRPQTQVLILTVAEDPITLVKAMAAGAMGYLIYGRFTPEELAAAVRDVGSGKTMFPTWPAPVVSSSIGLDPMEPGSSDSLTRREEEVLSLVALGKGNEEIASVLNLEEKTVKNYINTIYSKLHLKSRYEAISWVLRRSE